MQGDDAPPAPTKPPARNGKSRGATTDRGKRGQRIARDYAAAYSTSAPDHGGILDDPPHDGERGGDVRDFMSEA